MKNLTIQQTQAIGGANFIYAGGLPVPTDGISPQCVGVIETAFNDAFFDKITTEQAAAKITHANCWGDFFIFYSYIDAIYG